MASAELAVWLRGQRVATLTGGRPGRISLRYSKDLFEQYPRNTPILSC
jgi:hypothetical protein